MGLRKQDGPNTRMVKMGLDELDLQDAQLGPDLKDGYKCASISMMVKWAHWTQALGPNGSNKAQMNPVAELPPAGPLP